MIEYADITVSFSGRCILDRFSLEVERGEKVVMRGRSGTGKSTLLRLLLGFAVPDSGAVRFDGGPVTPETVRDIRRRTAYVGQDTDIGDGTVGKLIESLFLFKSTAAVRPSPDEIGGALEFLELEKTVLSERFAGLSGGEKQRISLLAALLLKREVFLLDEATAALDPALKRKMADYFLGSPDWTVLAISHDREWEHAGARIVEPEAL